MIVWLANKNESLPRTSRNSDSLQKKPTPKWGGLSDPTIHYTVIARRAIDEWAVSIACF